MMDRELAGKMFDAIATPIGFWVFATLLFAALFLAELFEDDGDMDATFWYFVGAFISFIFLIDNIIKAVQSG